MKISDMIIETERLKLRGFKTYDLEDVFEYSKSQNVGPNAGWAAHRDIEDSKKVLDMFIKNKDVLAIEYKGKVIGSIGIHDTDDICIKRIGYVLNEKYWGKGFMTEALKTLLEKLPKEYDYDINIFEDNKRSRRVAEKLGYRPSIIYEKNDRKYIKYVK